MNVTKVWVNLYNSGKLKGFADVVLDDVVTITGVRIFAKDDGNGFNVLMPAKEGKDKEGKPGWFPVVRINMKDPRGQEIQDHIASRVIAEYEKKAGGTPSKPSYEKDFNSGFDNDDGVPF